MKEVHIITEDGKEVGLGDRVFNYYDGVWGTITKIDELPQPNLRKDQNSGTPIEDWDDYWFTHTDDEGRRTSLNGQRISTYDPKERK
jgi:hypothetical protein